MNSTWTSRTAWRQKLEKPNVPLPKIVRVPARWQKRFGKGTLAIAHPLDVDALIRKVRKGQLVTQSQLRQRLARQYGADHTCPLTMGIFVRIVSEVAEEDRRAGKKSVSPYWRVLRDDGSLNEKCPGGAAAQARQLRAEGFAVEKAGAKRWRVRNCKQRLTRI